MLDQSQFLKNFNISIETFNESRIEWDDLASIHKHHSLRTPDLLSTGDLISDHLRQIDKVHSLKVRVKDPDHLLEKIIRKRAEDPARVINRDNYQTEITDLIGVRALHLFKDDWIDIHNAITSIWELHEQPTAYLRKGDSETVYRENNCVVAEHDAGYRSVHYLVKSQPTKDLCIIEIQVRTIFEEGWSEIDHRLRYPYDISNTILADYLAIFNRLAGNADEMGSYIKRLKTELEKRENYYLEQLEVHKIEKEKMIKSLEDIKKKLKNETEDKKQLQEVIDSMKRSHPARLGPDFAPYEGLGTANFPKLDYIAYSDSVLKDLNKHTCLRCLREYSTSSTDVLLGNVTCPFCGTRRDTVLNLGR